MTNSGESSNTSTYTRRRWLDRLLGGIVVGATGTVVTKLLSTAPNHDAMDEFTKRRFIVGGVEKLAKMAEQYYQKAADIKLIVDLDKKTENEKNARTTINTIIHIVQQFDVADRESLMSEIKDVLKDIPDVTINNGGAVRKYSVRDEIDCNRPVSDEADNLNFSAFYQGGVIALAKEAIQIYAKQNMEQAITDPIIASRQEHDAIQFINAIITAQKQYHNFISKDDVNGALAWLANEQCDALKNPKLLDKIYGQTARTEEENQKHTAELRAIAKGVADAVQYGLERGVYSQPQASTARAI